MTPEETQPPTVLRRANELAEELGEKRARPAADVLDRWVRDAELRALHTVMLPPQQTRRKGDYYVDLLTGLAKLEDAESVAEASAMLTNREKLMVLSDGKGVE